MVPTGVLLFDFETESAGTGATSPQVLAGKAENAKRREIALSAFCVNWSGAVIPLRSRKPPDGDLGGTPKERYRDGQQANSRQIDSTLFANVSSGKTEAFISVSVMVLAKRAPLRRV